MITRYNSVWLIHIRSLFLTVLNSSGGWKSEIRMPAGSGSGAGCRWPTSPCVLSWWKGKGALWGLLYKGTHPIHKGPTVTSQSPQTPSHWILSFNIWVWGDKNIQSIVGVLSSELPLGQLEYDTPWDSRSQCRHRFRVVPPEEWVIGLG